MIESICVDYHYAAVTIQHLDALPCRSLSILRIREQHSSVAFNNIGYHSESTIIFRARARFPRASQSPF